MKIFFGLAGTCLLSGILTVLAMEFASNPSTVWIPGSIFCASLFGTCFCLLAKYLDGPAE